MIDTLLCNLGNVNHSLLAGSKLKESTELLDADNLSFQNLILFEIGGDDLDVFLGFIHLRAVRSANGNGSVFVDINLYTRAGDDFIDILSLFADYITDLVRINLDLLDLRRVFVDGWTRSGDCLLHYLGQNILSGFLASGNGFLHDLTGKAVDLDIHLDCGDAVMCSGNLEVHVSEEVFKTLNICEHDIIVVGISGNKAAGNSGNGLLNGYTGSHQSHGRSTDGSL